MTRTLVAVFLGIMLVLSGCSTPGLYDGVYDAGSTATGYAVGTVDAPIGFVGGGFRRRHCQATFEPPWSKVPGL
jgi:hypothetical protein